MKSIILFRKLHAYFHRHNYEWVFLWNWMFNFNKKVTALWCLLCMVIILKNLMYVLYTFHENWYMCMMVYGSSGVVDLCRLFFCFNGIGSLLALVYFLGLHIYVLKHDLGWREELAPAQTKLIKFWLVLASWSLCCGLRPLILLRPWRHDSAIFLVAVTLCLPSK